MKLKFYLLLALCFMFVNKVSASSEKAPGYEVRYDNDSIMVTVIVDGNCSIPVGELKPPKCDFEIYGDKNCGGDGDLFKNETTNINHKLSRAFTFSKKSPNTIPATVSVNYEKMPDYAFLILYTAKKVKNKGYCPASAFPVIFKKDKGKGNGYCLADVFSEIFNNDNGNGESASSSSNDSPKGEGKGGDNSGNNDNKNHNNMPYNCYFLLVILIVFSLIGSLILYKNSKRRSVNNENSRNGIPKATKKSSQKKEKNGQTQLLKDQQSQPLSQMNNAVTDFLRSDEGKWFLKNNLSQLLNGQQSQLLSKIDKSVTEFLGSDDGKRLLKDALSKLLNNQQSQHSLSPIPTPAMDTDDVKYNHIDNSFSLGKPDSRIFRIYCKEGNYYYTIIEDPVIRKELAGMLNSFEKCITSQPSDSPADRIEPVKPGELRKEGDKFRVDVNNKLVVRFL